MWATHWHRPPRPTGCHRIPRKTKRDNQFTPKLFVTATYSHVRAYVDRFEDADSTWGSTYKYAQYVAANMFYNINSIVQVGVEYDYGRRVNYDGRQAHDNRLQAMLQVSF